MKVVLLSKENMKNLLHVEAAMVAQVTRAANQERLKSEFLSGLQQTFLDHSVRRCWMQQLKHWM